MRLSQCHSFSPFFASFFAAKFLTEAFLPISEEQLQKNILTGLDVAKQFCSN